MAFEALAYDLRGDCYRSLRGAIVLFFASAFLMERCTMSLCTNTKEARTECSVSVLVQMTQLEYR